MPRDGQIIFEDAQQAGGFLVPQLYRIHGAVLQAKYPSFDYAGLVPVNTDGTMWDIGTLVYSGDLAGAAAYIGGKAFDIPNASINFALGQSQFHLAGAGYELSLQEVNRAAQMNIPLDQRKASAARLVSQKFVYDRVIRGSTEKNTTGLINNASVPAASAPTGGWGTATPAQILADVNTALNDVITNSGETAMPNALILPTTAFLTANNTQVTNTNMSVLTFLKQNNSYTAMTGQELDIRASRELQAAGSGSSRRMVAYEKSPDNMEFFLPGMFEFLPPFAISSMAWKVDGIMNVGQLEIYRPKTVSYRDGI
jgi:hypothetical protein